MAAPLFNKETGKPEGKTALAKEQQKEVWTLSYDDDLVMLAQGIRDVKGIEKIQFIAYHKVPRNKKVTYGKKECSILSNKKKKHRFRLTVGGDRLEFDGVTLTQCASLTTLKLLLNSTISTPKARFDTMDIKKFYYGTPMIEYEYMKTLFYEITQ